MSVITQELERRATAARDHLARVRGERAAELSGKIGALMEMVAKLREEGLTMPSADELKQEQAERSVLNLVTSINEFILQVNDGIKGKLGAPSVRTFLKEVRNKLQAMLDEMPKETKEACATSIEHAHQALAGLEELATGALGIEELHALPDRAFALIEAGGELDADGRTVPRSLRWFPYRDAQGKTIPSWLKASLVSAAASPLTESQRVEAKATLLREAEAAKVDVTSLTESVAKAAARGERVDLAERQVLRDAAWDGKKGEVIGVLIEAGTNPVKRRHYPEATVREVASRFGGLKMYVDHPSAREERDRPERSVKDWASTIVESWFEGGKAMARIAVHQPWLRELLADPVARGSIGLSINTRGASHISKIDGVEMQVVDQILVERGEQGRFSSVDWVTEPGARGRVVEIFESRGQDRMSLELIHLADLKESRADLLEAYRKELEPELRKAWDQEQKGKQMSDDDRKLMETLSTRVSALEAANVKATQENLIRKTLDATRLSAGFKQRIVDSLAGQTYESEAKLIEAVQADVKRTLDLLKGQGLKVDGEGAAGGAGKSQVESLADIIAEQRMGIKPATAG
jgi:hypothetical protein